MLLRYAEIVGSRICPSAYNIFEGRSSDVMAELANTVDTDEDADLLDIDRLLDHNGTMYLIASNADQLLYRAVFESVINAVVRPV